MGDVVLEELERGDAIIYARVMPHIGYYELLDLKVVTVGNDYVTGCDSRTKQSYIFLKKNIDKVLFHNRGMALDYLEQQKQKYKNVKVACE